MKMCLKFVSLLYLRFLHCVSPPEALAYGHVPKAFSQPSTFPGVGLLGGDDEDDASFVCKTSNDTDRRAQISVIMSP